MTMTLNDGNSAVATTTTGADAGGGGNGNPSYGLLIVVLLKLLFRLKSAQNFGSIMVLVNHLTEKKKKIFFTNLQN